MLGGLVESMDTVKVSSFSAILSSTARIVAVVVAPLGLIGINITVSGLTALMSVTVQKERVDWCIHTQRIAHLTPSACYVLRIAVPAMGSKVTTRGQSSTPPPDVVRSTVTMKLLPSATEAIDERLTVASAGKRKWL